MKTISKVLFVTATVTAFAITGCKKEDTPAPVNSSTAGSLSSLNSFFMNNGAQSQFFTIDNNSTQSVTGSQGTILTFYANSFVTLSGGPVTGNVTIELKEVYGKKNMLLSGIPTNAELYPGGPTEPLVSGGEIYVNAKQGANQLKLAPGYSYQAALPSPAPPLSGMEYFRGMETAEGILWGGTDSSYCGTSMAPYTYFMNCDSLHWGNADQFLYAPSYTTVSLALSGTYDPAQIKAFVWYDNVNTIWEFWNPFDAFNQVYSDNHTALGQAVHLLVISVKDGKLCTGMVTTTVTANAIYNITMTETSETNFSNILSSLP